MSGNPQLKKLIDDFHRQQPIRAGSLIITVYGDVIAPRGGTVWLGSLISFLEPLGLSDRLVRTTISRLSKDSWLSATQIGRKSYYSLTDSGRRRFQNATPRIYAGPLIDWDGSWCLVILPQHLKQKRDAARKELGWLGFGTVSSGLMAHPLPDFPALKQTLELLDIHEDVILLTKARHDMTSGRALETLVHECWDLEELGQLYQDFLSRYRPVYHALRKGPLPRDEECALLRILMIHEYRKILLKDPLLPTQLLPAHWEGTAAHQLCRNIYRLLLSASEQYFSATLETADGPLPAPGAEFFRRFGGI
ncbi:phenylacetic acid degradation operon negative regulatory protein PaaX [Luteithermobacter gelatinilyticus]|uniref:phenylacetic acid degradation operon negative regulatory protein PaaX n=1 Tax=Luteithermobacter gelatinilyticus TaxID=2582913 RepID=UPI001105C5C6|nr:phenylacetic acid degradation operon negative regulatory protein PaaX [Luteithermobacter gelatinilyticus]|tara:strand:- start:14144 stop:15064 length:921 start_codon:yes stop_codon:yes gene_type:complete